MAAWPEGTVTFLLTEVVGSTALWESDPSAMTAATAVSDGMVAATVDKHGGVLVKPRGEGDSYFIVFADPAAAVQCAAEMAPRFGLPVRMAIHRGPVDLRDGDYYGPPVNRCARLRATAHAGQIVMSAAVAEALPPEVVTRSLGLHFLKDLSQPEHVFQLCHPSLPSEFAPLASLAAPANRLPLPLTSFVGRDELLDEAIRHLSTARFVQLCGPPGVGKSRVLLELAARWLDDHPGVTVHAEAVRDATVLRAPGLALFDDVDHAVNAVESPDGTAVIVSCRRPLGHGPEVVVPPLSASAAVSLFMDRSRAVRPDFDGAAEDVAAVCERVDRLPLAIELAAGRLSVLSIGQMLERLASPFRVLGGGRHGPAHHSSMRDAIAWTADALTAAEREAALSGGATAVATGMAHTDGVPSLVADYLRG
jgi:class 3 adenylate cyclase